MNGRCKILISLALTFIFILLIPQFILANAADGSRIANILVTDKNETEIYNDLADRVSQWMNEDDFILMSEYERLTLPRDIFEFDIQGTIDQFQKQSEQSFLIFFKKSKPVQIPLKVFVKQNHTEIEHLQSLDYIDSEQIMQQLVNMAENLEADSVAITYIDEKNLPFEQIATFKERIPEDLSHATMNNIVTHLNGQTIEPLGTFSILEAIDLPNSLKDANDELSYVATGLYETFLQTDLAIIERQHHLQLPKYAKPGLDVLIHEQHGKDLIVQNINHSALKINASLEKRELHIALESLKKEFTYNYMIENEETIKPRTIYRYSKDLSPGETKVVQKGADGFSIEIERTTLDQDEQVLRNDLISKDIYLPTPKIILASTEDAPEESESTVDPDDVDRELNELEQSLGDFNNWLTGDVDEDHLDERTFLPFLYFLPANYLSSVIENEQNFADRFAELEKMLQDNEQVADEIIITRLVELEQRLDELKSQYNTIIDALIEHELIEKGDE